MCKREFYDIAIEDISLYDKIYFLVQRDSQTLLKLSSLHGIYTYIKYSSHENNFIIRTNSVGDMLFTQYFVTTPSLRTVERCDLKSFVERLIQNVESITIMQYNFLEPDFSPRRIFYAYPSLPSCSSPPTIIYYPKNIFPKTPFIRLQGSI